MIIFYHYITFIMKVDMLAVNLSKITAIQYMRSNLLSPWNISWALETCHKSRNQSYHDKKSSKHSRISKLNLHSSKEANISRTSKSQKQVQVSLPSATTSLQKSPHCLHQPDTGRLAGVAFDEIWSCWLVLPRNKFGISRIEMFTNILDHSSASIQRNQNHQMHSNIKCSFCKVCGRRKHQVNTYVVLNIH